MLEKSRGLIVDCVAYDLEDSVTPGKKAEARLNIRSFLAQTRPKGVKENAVRINAVETGLALEDLTEVVRFSAPFEPGFTVDGSPAESAQYRHRSRP